MTHHLAQLLAARLQARGMSAEEANRLAEESIVTLIACDALQVSRVEAWERDARIHELRGQRLTASVIAVRMGTTPRRVFEAVHRHVKRRRAALKSAA